MFRRGGENGRGRAREETSVSFLHERTFERRVELHASVQQVVE